MISYHLVYLYYDNISLKKIFITKMFEYVIPEKLNVQIGDNEALSVSRLYAKLN